MNIFKDFSYRLLRTFAFTTGGCSVLLIYMGMYALHGNTMFLIAGAVMLLLTIVFAYASWQNYRYRPLSLKGNSTIYSDICPSCGEMLEEHVSVCPHCGQMVNQKSTS